LPLLIALLLLLLPVLFPSAQGKYGVNVVARASGGGDVLCLKASFTV
jgi:hypothetical protein